MPRPAGAQSGDDGRQRHRLSQGQPQLQGSVLCSLSLLLFKIPVFFPRPPPIRVAFQPKPCGVPDNSLRVAFTGKTPKKTNVYAPPYTPYG